MALDLIYDHQGNKFDLYAANDDTITTPLIVFVHGGAWRSEDKADHAEMAQRIAQKTGYAVAVPNYRLSSTGGDVKHPQHSEDILRFLQFIRSWQSSPVSFDTGRLYLIAHSCSAHMLCSIFCDSSETTPSLTPEPALVSSVQAIIFTEGIYDLDMLLKRFPEYKSWFIDDAFGDRTDYSSYSITRYPPRDARIRWLIIHSKGDALLDSAQSNTAITHISKVCTVTGNTEDFNVGHDDILSEESYIQLVADFIKAQ